MEKKEGFSMVAVAMILGVVLVLAFAGYLAYEKSKSLSFGNNTGQTACTQDAKQCPDGSYVSRTGPNCEFAQCPVVADQTAGWKTYRNNEHSFQFKYPATLGTNFANWNQEPTAIFSKMDAKNIDNGCYVSSQMEGVPTRSEITISGMHLCLTQSNGVGAGQLYKEYDYTGTRGDGFYFTLQYVVHTSNGCGAYGETANYQACQDFMSRYHEIVETPIEQSVATLQFTQ